MSTLKAAKLDNDLLSVYIQQWKALRGFLVKRVGSHDLAEEALQETWLRLATLSQDGAASENNAAISDRQGFILRVAGNIAIDLVRKERRHSSRCVSDDMLLASLADHSPSPEVYAIDRDQLRGLVKALAELPAKARSALLMSRCDGWPHRDIARKLSVSESMVARYLAQALRHCRDHLRAS
ncbi:RNA polymerase sigma factor [Pseudorhodoplanes sinuspersici]|uniref:Uncharacterized protein n=1 Tax=Pseudorhodoplanes sinuspersici TaxID=1235591 RepID=A0A1W6ZMM1_9HYPH|nr:RNA polymerase sigma factor [Pseudorhodoplanes sinuspersici]ARP98487.1 hypothetical protein CAK95_04835 [Pseudorhodoplanes sinuspersici]RKE65929.1 RNA polymerase sigma-70 factor (ECF subfamily) [Pseudorhodoplanes sinuspersici]